MSRRAFRMCATATVTAAAVLASAGAAGAAVSTGDDPASPSGLLPPDAEPAPSISGTELDGEQLTGSDGFVDAASRDRIWLRCSNAGTGCSQVAGTNTYTLTAADVGKVLKFRVRGTSTLGAYREAEDVTGVIAAIPTENTVPPGIAGTASQGATLTASSGTWKGSQPLTFSYTWKRCDPVCTQVVGTGSSYVVAATDVGHRVELTETASGPGGSAGASVLSGVVAAAPGTGTGGGGATTGAPVTGTPGTTGTTALRMLSPFPVIAIGGRILGRTVVVSQLRVSRAPLGATVSVTCKGRSCPFRRARRTIRRRGGIRLRSLERPLRSGTVIVIVVRKGNNIGKYTRLRIRRGAPPARLDRCIRPGAGRPSACPG